MDQRAIVTPAESWYSGRGWKGTLTALRVLDMEVALIGPSVFNLFIKSLARPRFGRISSFFSVCHGSIKGAQVERAGCFTGRCPAERKMKAVDSNVGKRKNERRYSRRGR